jgi:hypothetical protein
MACLLAGCQPAVLPTPAPAPSYRCTPEAGGDEFDCTQHQYDDMVAKDKLYAEAEAVYRRYLAEDARILRAGGVARATPVLLETTSGEFLTNVLKNYKALADQSVVARGNDPKLVYFKRAPGRSKTGSEVSANICVDGSSLEFSEARRSLGRGKAARDDTYFAHVDGVLKIIGADGSQVKSCD